MNAMCKECGTALVNQYAKRCVPCYRSSRIEWTREEIIAAISRFYVLNGRVPTKREWSKRSADWPGQGQVANIFGTFGAAMREAGLTPRRPGRFLRYGGGRQNSMPPEPTVANGYSLQEEIAWLIEQQAKDDHYGTRFSNRLIALDALSSEHISRRGISYSDAWTEAVCAVVDFRRDIDRWAEAA